VQSIVKTPAEALKKVTTLVVGQEKGKTRVVRVGQSVEITNGGDAKAINVCGGQETVMALTVEGMESVTTVAAVAVSVVTNGVWKVVPMKEESEMVENLFGGPSVIWGHGGRDNVRAVLPPFPSGSVMTTLGTSTLGVAMKPLLNSPLDVIFTLEKGIPPMTISEIVRVRVVVVVWKTVTTSPPPRVARPVLPYSTDVTKVPGVIVDELDSLLVGNTIITGAVPVTIGVFQISVPT
jgi:hypothetical protein